jgi:cellobiose epimerase
MNHRAIYIFFMSLIPGLLITACRQEEDRRTVAARELEEILNQNILETWYPATIDQEMGGYLTNFDAEWKQMERQGKFIVTQARSAWTCATVYEFYPDRKEYLEWSRHGVNFLRDKMWDAEYGGFFQAVNRDGSIADTVAPYDKRAYGNAFAIYGLAAYARVSGDAEALELAQRAFRWLDAGAHDPVHGGYFQFLNRDGSPIPRDSMATYPTRDHHHVGIKDYNSSIHLLEAFYELYRVWPDSLLRERLAEMYHVVNDIMMAPEGYLRLHFYPDWTLVQDEDITDEEGRPNRYTNHVTFGHDVETAYLLYEAALTLEIPIDSALLARLRGIVDHSLLHGWDAEVGGFYDAGKFVDGQMQIINKHKSWWGQAEGLNSLLLMHTLFPDDPVYFERFLQMQQYIDTYLVDHTNGDWYHSGLDQHPDAANSPKAGPWKGNYHTVRSLINCIRMLRGGHHH